MEALLKKDVLYVVVRLDRLINCRFKIKKTYFKGIGFKCFMNI